MPIRLEGGYELRKFWGQVREIANKMLEKRGLSDWTVTLRPVTVADTEHASRDETVFATYDREGKKVAIAFVGNGKSLGTPEEVAKVQIVAFVDQGANPDEDDWRRGT